MPHLPPVASAIAAFLGVALAIFRLLTASKAFWWKFPEQVQKGLPALLVALGALPAALGPAKTWTDFVVALVFTIGTYFTASRGDKRPVEPPKDGSVRKRVKSDPKAEAFDDTTPPSLPGATMTTRRGAFAFIAGATPLALLALAGLREEQRRPLRPLAKVKGGTIQKVEIVVTSNQNPSRIARAVVAHIAKVARPTVSALAILMLCASCSLFSKVDWPKVVQCGGDLAQAELSAVQRILAGNGDTTAELENLAKSYAPSTIECAVQQVISDLQGHGFAMSRSDVAAVQRGREFLAKVQK